MKRILTALLALCLVMGLPMTVAAEEEDFSFAFELSVDGKDSKKVEPGDIITVVVKLKREDADASFPMYAMQDEIRYDSRFFELVEDSVILNQGMTTTDIATADRYREMYMNFLSMSGGNQWNPDTILGSFQLRVIGDRGVSHITNQDYLVSSQDGTERYPCRAQDLVITLSTDCVVTFHTNGGTEIPDAVAEYGSLLKAPADPVKEGYHLEGWYRDIHLTEKWDFAKDKVEGNLSLYAKWAEWPADSAGDKTGMLILAAVVLLILWLLHRKKKKEERRR